MGHNFTRSNRCSPTIQNGDLELILVRRKHGGRKQLHLSLKEVLSFTLGSIIQSEAPQQKDRYASLPTPLNIVLSTAL